MSAADIQAVAELRQRYWLNGYRPVAVYTGHKRPIGKGWLADAMRDPPLWATWQPIEAALSTGIATGRLVGVDVDVLIQPVVDRIVFEIQAGVCATPLVRIGRAPKTLLCFRCDGDPFRKLQTEVFIMPDGSEAKVELLAEGQQFVADGIHPDTGLAYLWPAGSPETVPLVDVPAITLEQAQAIVDAARALLIANGGVPKKKPQKERPRRERTPSGCQPEGHTFFAKVNSAALGNLDAWAPDVFPTAVYQSGTGAYRVASADLGRDLEEDISLHPAGIQDFGREHGMTAIDVVVEFGEASSPVQAALWLCGKLGLDPAQLGWRNSVSGNSGAVPPHAANGAGQEPPPGWEKSHPGRGESPRLLEAPWVPTADRPVPLAAVQTAITHLTHTFLADAHNADLDARMRAEQAEFAEAEQKARAKAVKAERVLHARTDRRNVLVETIQGRLATGAPMGNLRADARKADAKVQRAAAAHARHYERWTAVAAKLVPITTPPLAKPYVINSAETGTAKTGIFVKLAKGQIDTRKASNLPGKLIMMVPALRPDVVVEPDATTMAAFYADKATPRQRTRVLKYLAQQAREKEGNAPRNVERLGQQLLKRARAAGLDAAVFMGRGDDNCRHTDAIDLARTAGADPSVVVCGSKDHPCPSRGWCMREGYMAGVLHAAAADVPIVAHNFITEDLPASVRAGAWAVAVDEEFATQADFETDLTLESIQREAFESAPARRKDSTPDLAATAMLVEQLGHVVTAHHACGGRDYLSHDALTAAGLRLATLQDPVLRQAELKALRDANWSRKVMPNMWPEMSLEERRAETDRCAVNRLIRRIDALLRAIDRIVTDGDAGAGLVTCRASVTARGNHNDLIIRGQKPAADWIAALPVFTLNATANLDLARQTLPDFIMPPMPKAERPHAETHQILGRWGGYHFGERTKLIADLRTFITLNMMGRRRGLVIVYKGAEHHFTGIPNVDTAHHGDIAGDDSHRDYDFLLVIGGAFADYEAVAAVAAGRGNGAVPIVQSRPVTRVATLTDGTAVAMPNVMAYAHPGVDAAHDSIFRASVIQAAGRIDQFRRSLDNTCVTYILANVIMDRPMTSIRLWSQVKPGRGQSEIAAGRVAFGRVWMHILNPGIYGTVREADTTRWREDGTMARKRERVLRIIALDSVPWFSGRGQAAGQGQKPGEVLFRAGGAAAARADLEAELGPLLWWTVTQVTPGTDVQRSQLHQDLTRPVRSTSPEEEEGPPIWQAEGASTEAEPVHGPPDG